MTATGTEMHEVPPAADAVARLFAALIHPIAWPAWFIEWLVSRWRPGWYFSPFSATPYLSAIALLSGLGVATAGTLVAGISLYLLTAMEALALWICLAIAVGRPSGVFSLLRRYGRRPYKRPLTMFSPVSLYMGVVSYGYTIFYFAFLSCFLFRLRPTAFTGVDGTTSLGVAWEFLYYSTVTIATLGYGDITPDRPVSQAFAIMEVLIGMFFGLFVFGAFVSFHVNRLQKDGA